MPPGTVIAGATADTLALDRLPTKKEPPRIPGGMAAAVAYLSSGAGPGAGDSPLTGQVIASAWGQDAGPATNRPQAELR